MLQQMRSLAKYVWLFVAVAFIGGFLLVETSGLLGRTVITPTTAVAVVNGREILYSDFINRVQQQVQQEQQQLQQRGSTQSLTQDDNRRIENDVFDQMVMEVLLGQEYEKRHILVTEDEIKVYARELPPDWLVNQPELQTNGQFDMAKYQRYLSSSTAKQQGLLLMLEQHYRSEIPRRKLFDQIAAGAYVGENDLWRTWRDQHDSASASFVAFRPGADPAVAQAITDDDVRKYFDAHKDQFKRAGRAVLSVLEVPRVVSAADTVAARNKALALRAEIVGGEKFETVADRESPEAAGQGGDLGRAARGRFVADFEKVAWALPARELSQPVLTQFGYHLIRVDEKKADTLALRHILVPITPSDSSTSRIDRRADSLSNLAGNAVEPKKFDDAAAALRLTPVRVTAIENQPATAGNRVIPSVSAWAFGGAVVGETSELFDDETGYYIARLDSLEEASGDAPAFDAVKSEVRARVITQRELDNFMQGARLLADAATVSLESAATAKGLTVEKTPMFTRSSFVPGLGQVNEAVGAAFGLPVGVVSQPIRTDDAVFVLRVDRRVAADSAAWVAQKSVQKQQRAQGNQQQAIQMYLQDLRQSAKVDDRRKSISAAVRRQAT
ncbi:MAG: peptidyl-prolyl cis-trans isomerase [Gemmatimonadaceae bacterium]